MQPLILILASMALFWFFSRLLAESTSARKKKPQEEIKMPSADVARYRMGINTDSTKDRNETTVNETDTPKGI